MGDLAWNEASQAVTLVDESADVSANINPAGAKKALYISITDGTNIAAVSSLGELKIEGLVTAVPPGNNPKDDTQLSNVTGTVDSFYVITSGKTLTFLTTAAGSQTASGGNRISIYYDPNGDLSVLTLIAALYVNGNSSFVNLNNKFLGDGIRRIVLRRTRLGGGASEIFGSWQGYENL